MAVGRPKTELVLSAEEHAQVSALAASRSLPHAIVARQAGVVGGAGREQLRYRTASELEHADGGQVAPALCRAPCRRPARNCGPDVRAPTATSRWRD